MSNYKELIVRWTYESVEYSDGYYHTVFDQNGEAHCECRSEKEAAALVESKNKEMGL